MIAAQSSILRVFYIVQMIVPSLTKGIIKLKLTLNNDMKLYLQELL